MAVDPQVRALAQRINKLERHALQRKQPALAHSSIDDGAIVATDGDGGETMIIGQQVDGTSASTVLVGPVPPTPTAALVTPSPGGMRIYWDGTFIEGAVAPMDFSRVTAHLVSSMTGFDPTNPATIVGELNSATGSEVSLSAAPGEYLAVLVAWSQAGRFSAYSDPQVAIPGDIFTTDGLPPTGSPATTLTPLYATLVANWPAQENADLVGYEVYLDGPDFTPQMIGTTHGTSYQIAAKPDGTPLARNTTYTAWVRAFDTDGYAASTGAPGTAQLTYILPADIEQQVLDDIAQAQTDATTALADAGTASTAATAAQAAADQAIQDALDAANAAAAAQATADNSIRTHYSPTEPWPNGSTGHATDAGDMWFDESDGQAYRWNDNTKTWVIIEDSSIAAALAAAQAAQAAADANPTDADLAAAAAAAQQNAIDVAAADATAKANAAQAAAAADATAKANAAQAAATAAAAADATAKAEAAEAAAAADASAKANQAYLDAKAFADAANAAALTAAGLAGANGSVFSQSEPPIALAGAATSTLVADSWGPRWYGGGGGSGVDSVEVLPNRERVRVKTWATAGSMPDTGFHVDIPVTPGLPYSATVDIETSRLCGGLMLIFQPLDAAHQGIGWIEGAAEPSVAGEPVTLTNTAIAPAGATYFRVIPYVDTVGNAGQWQPGDTLRLSRPAVVQSETVPVYPLGLHSSLWIDTNDGNKPYVWGPLGGWEASQDAGIAAAAQAAVDAEAAAIAAAATDATAKANAAQQAAEAAAAADASAKADAAETAAIAAAAADAQAKAGFYSTNPDFEDWPVGQATPTGTNHAAGVLPYRETGAGLVRTGTQSMRFDTIEGANDYIGLHLGITSRVPHRPEYLVVEVDFMLVAGGGLEGAGVLCDWLDGTEHRVNIHLAEFFPTVTTGVWYRLSKVVKRPATGAGATSFAGYIMGNWQGFGWARGKSIVFDRVDWREASTEEITAYNTPGSIAAAKAQTLAEASEYVQSRGTDLFANGTGLLGTNYNLPTYTFNQSDMPVGASGVFDSTTGNYDSSGSAEIIPIDPGKRYRLSFQAKQKGDNTGNPMLYGYVAPYDAFGDAIYPNYHMFTAGTTTTLAAPLNPGDTTVTLTSAANWYGSAGKPAGGNTHLRTFIFWDYVDPGGKAWAPETFSHNHYGYDTYADGAVVGNVITLRAPWAGPAKPAGTPLSNGSSGGTFMYGGAVGVIVPTEWTAYSASIQGYASPGSNADFTTGWPQGTAACRIGFLANYYPGINATSKHSVAMISFSDAAAAQETANSKGKVIIQSAAPAVADQLPQNLWIDTTAGNNTPKRWDGDSWEIVTDKVATDAANAAVAAANAAAAAQASANQALNDALAANTAAGNAQTTANGKNAVWYLASAPSGTSHKLHDIWFDIDDGYTPYAWDGDSWEPKQWGHQSIATLDVGKATIGFLAAARIAANSLGVQHLAVGSVDNLWPDPLFNLVKTEPNPPAVPALTVRMLSATHATTPAPPAGGNVALLNNRDHIAQDSVTAKAGDEFLVELTYKYVSGAAFFYPGLWQMKADGTNTAVRSSWDNERREILSTVDLGDGWFRQTSVVQVNLAASDCARVALWLQIDQAGVSGTVVAVSDLSFRRRGKGTLLVDGAISAKQVGADIIVANDLYARNAYLGEVQADQIKTGGLSATLAVLGGLTVGPDGEAPRILINPIDGIKILLDEGVIHFPPDGSPAEITAGINAKWIVIEDRLSIRGQGEIQGAVSLANGITKPNVAPGVSSVYQSRTSTYGDGSADVWDIFRGLVEVQSDKMVSAMNFFGVNFRYAMKDASWSWGFDAFVSDPDDPAYDRNWRSDKGFVHGFCKIGTEYFILWQDASRPSPGTYDGRFYLTRLDSTFQRVSEIFIGESTAFGGRNPALVNIEGRIGMIWQSASKAVWLRLYTTALASASVTDKQLMTLGSFYNVMDAHYGAHGVGGAYRLWVAFDGSSNLCFTPTDRLDPTAAWSRYATEDFARAGNAIVKGLAFDTRAEGNVQDPDVNGVTPPIRNYGDRFISFTGVGIIHEYGRNPVAEATRVAYAWYDGAGTTHKTEEGATTTHARLARTGISIEAPPAPDINNTDAGNPDKANQIIIYATNEALPAKVKQQAILPIGTRALVLWNNPAVGVEPSLTNEFATAGSTPGVLDSTAEDSLGAIIRLSGAGDGRVGPLAWDTLGRALRDQGAERPGTIIFWSAPTVPLDCAVAQGQAVPRPKTAGYGGAAGYASSTSDVYQRLFSEFGTTYGAGDGSTTFNLPDYRGRILMGVGTFAASLTANEALAEAARTLQHEHTIAHTHGAGTLANSTFSHNTISNTPTGGGTAKLTGPTDHSHSISGSTGASSAANSGTTPKTGAGSMPFHGVYILIKL